ncbi:MAG: HAMP domain-containing histidine kinase [Dysgonamonadaceae bacterium]|jgi:signal transduction histidine kinase|nr:HAMP domain-containing histidine kinase [Dysgonamonadaceae bacterium]
MRKSTIWLLAGVMVFAFIGLMYLQINYILIILNTQRSQFEDAVKRGLYQVSHNLELDEISKLLNDQLFIFGKKYMRGGKTSIASQRINIKEQQRLSIDGSGQQLSTKLDINRGEIDSLSILSPSFGKNDINTASRAIQDAMKDQYFYYQNLLDEVIQNAMKANEKPIDERIDYRKLESYIRAELANNDLALPFVFAVLDKTKNIIYKSPDYNQETLKNIYSQILFPKDPANNLYTLQVSFPTQEKYVLNSNSFIVPSIIFTFVLLVVFIFTIYVILRQKRLSEMKNDFINNMTHELKTPVASISLAAQTLNDTDVNNSPHLMEHAKKVISDESKRLGFLVEKVLQMSLFEDRATQYKMTKLDANDLITNIASTFALRVENAGGILDIDLEALDSTILVDKMHFTNVLFNLMENAVKYRRREIPLILIIRTLNVGDKIQIVIEDNGIGIRKESLKKIFDRFYRVPTGNRHDVKGFGLGLAYVQRIITELDGTIKAESEYGEGTKFIITLPYINN